MAIIASFEKVTPRDDEAYRFLCTYECDGTTVKKSVAVSKAFTDSAQNQKDIADEILRQVDFRSKEADRHAEFINAKQSSRPDRNPKFLYQQSLDARLYQKIPPAEILKQV